MSHLQFYCIMFIHRRAWLNLLDERMTTGRVNQVVRFRINSAHIMYIIYSILFIQFVMFIVTYAKIVYTYILMWYIIYEWFTYYLQEKGPKPSLYLEIQNNRGEWRVEERYPAKDSRIIEMPLGGNNLSLVAESALGTSVYPGMEATDDQVVFETNVFSSDFRFGGLPQLHLDVTPAGPGGSSPCQ